MFVRKRNSVTVILLVLLAAIITTMPTAGTSPAEDGEAEIKETQKVSPLFGLLSLSAAGSFQVPNRTIVGDTITMPVPDLTVLVPDDSEEQLLQRGDERATSCGSKGKALEDDQFGGVVGTKSLSGGCVGAPFNC